MKSRSEKYYDENSNYIPTRTNRNSNLYKEINNSDLSNFNIASNAKVIGENESNYVNVEKIKEILEKNYHDVPKRREVKLSSKKPKIPLEIEQTKEYDINAILEKAREEKEVDYEKERLKKVRDTQYDILKNLNVEEEHTTEIKAADSKTKEELLELINTITENELQKTKLDPLDILTDLKGEDSNTVVMGVKDDTVALLNQEISKLDEEKKIEKDNAIDNSFYTNSLSFTQSDFDDFNDLKEDVESNKMVLKIIIIIMTLVIIIGIIIFLNKFLNLGLF